MIKLYFFKFLPSFISFFRLFSIVFIVINFHLFSYFSPVLTYLIFLFLYWITDNLDGFLARLLNSTSKIGEYIDLAIDRYCDLFLSILTLYMGTKIECIAVVIFLTCRFPTDYILGRSMSVNSVSYDGFIASEKIESMFPKLKKLTLEVIHFIRGSFFAGCLIPNLNLTLFIPIFVLISIGYLVASYLKIFRSIKAM